MTLGGRIKQLRISKGLTQAELGRQIEKAESTVRTWELDRAQPAPRTMLLLCRVLSTTPDILMGVGSAANFGERVKYLRTRKGMSVSQLAKKIDVSQSTVKGWETSEKDIASVDADKIPLLLDALDTSMIFLLGLTEDPNPSPRGAEAANIEIENRESVKNQIAIDKALKHVQFTIRDICHDSGPAEYNNEGEKLPGAVTSKKILLIDQYLHDNKNEIVEILESNQKQ